MIFGKLYKWCKSYAAVMLFAAIVLFMLAMYLAALYFYFSKILPVDSYAADKFGQFGDFVGGVCNPILGTLTLVGIILSLFYQKHQIILSKNEAIRAEFYEMAGLLSEIIDKIDAPSNGANPFEWLFGEFKRQVGLLAVMRIKSQNLDRYFCESTLQLIVDKVIDSKDVDVLGESHIHYNSSVKQKYDFVVGEIGVDRVFSRIKEECGLLEATANDYLEFADPRESEKVVIHSAKRALIASRFAFGPFVKTVIRMIETCQKAESVNTRPNLWPDLKSQLNSYQMAALMINTLAGRLNRSHDELIRSHAILNDICLLDDPIVDHAVQIYEDAELAYPK